MKNNLLKLFMLFAILFTLNNVYAQNVWRVNNRPGVNADFVTVQAAITGASAGDTIYVEGSEISYGVATISKQLTIIGAGFFLNNNDTTQAYKQLSRVGAITFNNGSEGSVLEGCYVTGGYVQINTDNITIRRNYINYTYYGIRINENPATNIFIEQNWIQTSYNNTDSRYGGIILHSSTPDSVVIRNNFIRHTGSSGNAITFYNASSTSNNAIIYNNVIWGKLNTYYGTYYNNIQLSGNNITGTTNFSANNICNATQFPAVNGNQRNINMTTVFTDPVGYIDNDYELIPMTSPAIGAGIAGGDCGVFNNISLTEYNLSGLPAIPANFNVSHTQGAAALTINVKAKSHK